ncbi:MAG TPA: DUF4416 family protein [bacterium]|nr:DUF4416 family protein [bacterium]
MDIITRFVRSSARSDLGQLHETLPVKPVCGVMAVPGFALYPVFRKLEARLGPIEDRSRTFPFRFSDYYRKEMGDSLEKCWVSFRMLMPPEELSELKRFTNDLESELSVEGRRRVNLDPGYVTAAKLVLASTKDFAHRVCLGGRIYGDVQLRYIRGAFRPSDWTYPDYSSGEALAFFTRVRERFQTQEKKP